jgi:hypothetical protein
MIKAVYVEQFGGWWKFTPDQWRALLLEGIETGGHVIQTKELAARPRKIHKFQHEGGRASYYCGDENVLIYSALDWEEAAYRAALEKLDNLLKSAAAPAASGDPAPSSATARDTCVPS